MHRVCAFSLWQRLARSRVSVTRSLGSCPMWSTVDKRLSGTQCRGGPASRASRRQPTAQRSLGVFGRAFGGVRSSHVRVRVVSVLQRQPLVDSLSPAQSQLTPSPCPARKGQSVVAAAANAAIYFHGFCFRARARCRMCVCVRVRVSLFPSLRFHMHVLGTYVYSSPVCEEYLNTRYLNY